MTGFKMKDASDRRRRGLIVLLIVLLCNCVTVNARGRANNGRGGHLRDKKCTDQTLAVRERKANVIFTGTVRKLIPHSNGTVITSRNNVKYDAVVDVKRLLKGAVIGRVNGAQRSDVDADTSGIGTVLVENFGNTDKICRGNVRERDTRIFMVVRLPNGVLRLNSSLIRVTLRNLDAVMGVIRGNKKINFGPL
ncbi:hypothetical protein CHUAL_000874 [Chamberlinius hualienensis]